MKRLSPAMVKKMCALAIKARDNAYAPYSDHPVGSAVLATSGKVYSGANCEIANYDSTCSENTSLAAMVTGGDRVIRAIMTVAPSGKYLCTPCGRCRQRIREFCDSDTLIYAMYDDGRLGAIYTMDDLLPASFGPEHMAVVGHGPVAKRTLKKKKKIKNDKRKKRRG